MSYQLLTTSYQPSLTSSPPHFLTALRHELSTMSYQPSLISSLPHFLTSSPINFLTSSPPHCSSPWTISHQLPAITFFLTSSLPYFLTALRHELRAMSYQPSAKSYKLLPHVLTSLLPHCSQVPPPTIYNKFFENGVVIPYAKFFTPLIFKCFLV